MSKQIAMSILVALKAILIAVFCLFFSITQNWYTYRDPRRLVEPPIVVSNQKQLQSEYVLRSYN